MVQKVQRKEIFMEDVRDPEVFKRYERMVYDGTLNYNSFPGNEYKYFDQLAVICDEFKADEITREQFNSRRAYLLDEYHNAVDEADDCFPEKIKQVIMLGQRVTYRGAEYTVNKIMLGGHYKEPRWYYQVELLDKNNHSVVIADWSEVVKENKT